MALATLGLILLPSFFPLERLRMGCLTPYLVRLPTSNLAQDVFYSVPGISGLRAGLLVKQGAQVSSGVGEGVFGIG